MTALVSEKYDEETVSEKESEATATTSITSQAYGTISISFLTLSFPTEPFYNKTMNTAVPWAPVWQTNMAKDCKWGALFFFFPSTQSQIITQKIILITKCLSCS